MMRFLVVAFLACSVAGEDGKQVRLKTEDGLEIAGTYWAPRGKAGGAVVLLPMYRGTRSDYAPLIPHLRARRLAVLAIDLRGHGESAAKLADRVAARDAGLFAAMHQDAIAAVRWLARKHKRVGVVGASVGCSVAIDAARRHPKEVVAVLCMTPGKLYLGLDSVAHGKEVPKAISVAFVAHRDEAKVGATALDEVIATSELRVLDTPYPAGQDQKKGYFHGTRMFGRVELIEQWVAGVMAVRLDAMPDEALLDGSLDQVMERKATALERRKGGRAFAYRVGRRLVFGGLMPEGITLFRLKVRAASGKVNWEALERGVMSPDLQKYSFLNVLLEAPTAYVRECAKNRPWKDADPGGKAPPSRGARAPVRIAFVLTKKGYSFEGELTLPELKKRKQAVEVVWGWEEKLGGLGSIRFGPGGELDLRGKWVRVPSR